MAEKKDQEDVPALHQAQKSSALMPKKYTQEIFLAWCKGCGICSEFCPKDVFQRREDGKPKVVNPDQCIGCLFCELHCPDFAISITEILEYKRRTSDV